MMIILKGELTSVFNSIGQVPIFHSQMQVAYMLWDTLFLSAFSSMNLKFLALFP